MHIINQMLDFLPTRLKTAFNSVNLQHVYEIRLRAEKPITVNLQGDYVFLTEHGLSSKPNFALIATSEEIECAVLSAGNYSVYSVQEQLKQGFITAKNGVRIGLSGHYVFENGHPVTVRNFTSLCIRIPHEILGCAERLYREAFQDGLHHLLIGGPPGQGKTTLLRDLCRLICQKKQKNILICDERGEIASGDVGDFSDIFSFADKKIALEMGVRAMHPDIIVTDELAAGDLPSVARAVSSGVIVIASIHVGNFEEISVEYRRLFQRIAILDGEKVGSIKAIYKDEKGTYCND